jgi:D-erythrulose 1-phosphate 3-epimerase
MSRYRLGINTCFAVKRWPEPKCWAEIVRDRLGLDVGHQCVPGTTGPDRDPYAWLERLGGRAPVVQLQQSDAAADHHWPFTRQRNATGRIEADQALAALDASGASGTALILQVIPPFEQDDDEVVRELEESVAYWRAALARRR